MTVTSVSNTDGTLTISPTTGDVVASLNLGKADTWTAAQTFQADAHFKSGTPFVDVTTYGAVGDGATDCTAAIQNAINAAYAITSQGTGGISRGAILYFPPGTYVIQGAPLICLGYMRLVGAGKQESVIINTSTTADLFHVGLFASFENIALLGSGAPFRAGAAAVPTAGWAIVGGGSTTFTANTTSSSTTLSGVSSTAHLVAGESVSGTGIPAGTVISSISGSTITMSAAATSSGSGITITASVPMANECKVSSCWVGDFYNGVNFANGSNCLMEFCYVYDLYGDVGLQDIGYITNNQLDMTFYGGIYTWSSGFNAWAASTSYAAGSVVSNNAGYFYCSVAGTSASSGGPSPAIFGTNITDGTCTWVFLCKTDLVMVNMTSGYFAQWVIGNDIAGPMGVGIYSNHSGANMISDNNVVQQIGISIKLYYDDGSIVTANQLGQTAGSVSVGGNVINANQSTNFVISNNRFAGSSQDSLDIAYSTYFTVTGNNFSGPYGDPTLNWLSIITSCNKFTLNNNVATAVSGSNGVNITTPTGGSYFVVYNMDWVSIIRAASARSATTIDAARTAPSPMHSAIEEGAQIGLLIRVAGCGIVMRAKKRLRLAMNVNVTPEQSRKPATPPFEIERLGVKLGAEVRGLDLKEPMDRATFAALEAALIEHKVLVLRDQHMNTAQHVAMSRQFGELEVHPMRPQGEFPEILVLDNHKDNPVLSTDVWHSDTTFRKNPTKYTILRCQIMPKLGGDTLWADMEAAYEGLSEPFRRMIDGLRAVHDFANFRVLFKNTDEDRAKLRKMEDLFPNPSHPVVRTHPATGRKSIYVNPQFTLRIEGLEPAESRALLDVLFAQAQVPEYQFRLRWAPGTIVFWDNRSTQHYAANDYYPERRRMERTAVVGDVPF